MLVGFGIGIGNVGNECCIVLGGNELAGQGISGNRQQMFYVFRMHKFTLPHRLDFRTLHDTAHLRAQNLHDLISWSGD